jgi:hypothetical protein
LVVFNDWQPEVMIIAAVIAVNRANLFGLKEVIDADIIVSQKWKDEQRY